MAKPQNPDDELVIINVQFANDLEPKRIFVSCNDHPFLIERGKDVAVPRKILRVLDDAVIGVPEIDENDPDRVRFVDRKRFPYSIVGTVPSRAGS